MYQLRRYNELIATLALSLALLMDAFAAHLFAKVLACLIPLYMKQ